MFEIHQAMKAQGTLLSRHEEPLREVMDSYQNLSTNINSMAIQLTCNVTPQTSSPTPAQPYTSNQGMIFFCCVFSPGTQHSMTWTYFLGVRRLWTISVELFLGFSTTTEHVFRRSHQVGLCRQLASGKSREVGQFFVGVNVRNIGIICFFFWGDA